MAGTCRRCHGPLTYRPGGGLDAGYHACSSCERGVSRPKFDPVAERRRRMWLLVARIVLGVVLALCCYLGANWLFPGESSLFRGVLPYACGALLLLAVLIQQQVQEDWTPLGACVVGGVLGAALLSLVVAALTSEFRHVLGVLVVGGVVGIGTVFLAFEHRRFAAGILSPRRATLPTLTYGLLLLLTCLAGALLGGVLGLVLGALFSTPGSVAGIGAVWGCLAGFVAGIYVVIVGYGTAGPADRPRRWVGAALGYLGMLLLAIAIFGGMFALVGAAIGFVLGLLLPTLMVGVVQGALWGSLLGTLIASVVAWGAIRSGAAGPL